LRIREAAETVAILAWVALHDSDLREFLTIGLTDIEHIGSAKTCDGGRSLFPFFFVPRFATNDGSKNQDALLALLHEAAKLIPDTEAGNITGFRLLRSDQQHIVKTVAVEASNGLEIAGERLAVARLQRSDELFRRPSVISLICSDFIFRSPVRGFGSLTRRRGTKGPHWQENGRVLDQGAGADGNRRDTSR